MSRRWGRSADEIRLDLAQAIADGEDPITALERSARLRNGGDRR